MLIGDLFSGIGGFSLAARWMGWETAWFSEIDPYCSAVLAKHWPGVPNLGDITRVDWGGVERIDLLSGGFPCQPVSCAGKRRGKADARWLWPEFARAIRDLRPRWVVAENVPGLFRLGFDGVLRDLAEMGYDADWGVLSAADVGAPHLRKRVWIVAHPNGQGLLERERLAGIHSRSMGSLAGEITPRHCADVADAGSLRRVTGRAAVSREAESGRAFGDPTGCDRWESEPNVGRVANGIPARVDRLRGLGNAIVPRCAYQIFQAIERVNETVL